MLFTTVPSLQVFYHQKETCILLYWTNKQPQPKGMHPPYCHVLSVVFWSLMFSPVGLIALVTKYISILATKQGKEASKYRTNNGPYCSGSGCCVVTGLIVVIKLNYMARHSVLIQCTTCCGLIHCPNNN